MKRTNDLGSTLLKSTLLLNLIIWILVIHSQGFNTEMVPFMIFSTVPILIILFFVIIITIMPFFWFSNEDLSNNQIFRRFFPYYAILSMLLFFYLAAQSNFNEGMSTFSLVVFFVLNLSWIWLCKPLKHQSKNEKELVS